MKLILISLYIYCFQCFIAKSLKLIMQIQWKWKKCSFAWFYYDTNIIRLQYEFELECKTAETAQSIKFIFGQRS